jgi:hypothetical protein
VKFHIFLTPVTTQTPAMEVLSKCFVLLILFLGAIILIYQVKKRVPRLPPIFVDANNGLKILLGEYHLWKFGSMIYGLILAGLLFNVMILDNERLFTTLILSWIGGGVAGLVLLHVKGYAVQNLGILLELLPEPWSLVLIIPFIALGSIILIIALFTQPRKKIS